MGTRTLEKQPKRLVALVLGVELPVNASVLNIDNCPNGEMVHSDYNVTEHRNTMHFRCFLQWTVESFLVYFRSRYCYKAGTCVFVCNCFPPFSTGCCDNGPCFRNCQWFSYCKRTPVFEKFPSLHLFLTIESGAINNFTNNGTLWSWMAFSQFILSDAYTFTALEVDDFFCARQGKAMDFYQVF